MPKRMIRPRRFSFLRRRSSRGGRVRASLGLQGHSHSFDVCGRKVACLGHLARSRARCRQSSQKCFPDKAAEGSCPEHSASNRTKADGLGSASTSAEAFSTTMAANSLSSACRRTACVPRCASPIKQEQLHDAAMGSHRRRR